MDTELNDINQGVDVEVQEKKFENIESSFENINYSHCFEQIDSHLKIEIEDDKKYLWNGYSNIGLQKVDNLQPNSDTGLQNMQQVQVKEEKFEIDGPSFENVDYTHCFETTDLNFQNNLHKNVETNLRSIKQEVNVKEKLVNNDKIYIFENTESNIQDKGHGGNCNLVEVMNITVKQEIKKPPQELEDENCNENFKNISNCENHDDSDLNFQNNLHKNVRTTLRSIKQEVKVKEEKLESNDKIYIFENTESKIQDKGHGGNCNLVEVMNVTVKRETLEQRIATNMSSTAALIDFSTLRRNYRRYSEKQKRRAVDITKELGVRKTAKVLKIPLSTLATWKKSLMTDTAQNRMGRPLSYDVKIDDNICTWVLTKREQHLPVTKILIAAYAHKVIPTLGFKGSKGWVDRFLRRHNFVLRARTSLAQHLPGDLERRIEIFHNHLRELRLEHDFDPDCIINMDETPLYFDMMSGKVVAQKGAKDVVVRTTCGEKRQITAVLAVASNGKVLPPLIIFKGKRFPKDITNIPENVYVEVQEKAWMTEAIMIRWLTKVVRPYTLRRPTLLVMDSFASHTTAAVRDECMKINVTPCLIPGGCTSKVQPLDVSINKPFKTYMRAEWVSFINQLSGGERIKPASRQQMLDWVATAWAKIQQRTDMIAKSFKVCGISTALDDTDAMLVRNEQLLEDVLLSDEEEEEFCGFGPDDISGHMVPS